MRDFRKALSDEMNQIYLMGFDVWSDGASEKDYLADCSSSIKYKRGEWYVLTEDDKILSSLIIYDFGDEKFGIGSIATSPYDRKKGYASELIKHIIHKIESGSKNCILFLYSDIQPEFYEKFGFTRLKPEAQRYKTTTCMVYGKRVEEFMNENLITPEYF